MIKNKIIKWSSLTLALSVFVLTAVILFSPYGSKNDYTQKAIVVETEINAPTEKVYGYLGESSEAARWSTFVRSIKTLNQVPDGNVGSKRRCFGLEEGIVWDEEILVNQENERRMLSVYNAQGFPMMADHLLTEQVYKKISENKTKLKLSLFFKKGKRNLVDDLKMYVAAYFVEDIFEGNLANIKEYVEQSNS